MSSYFPLTPFPGEEFRILEKGLIQRVDALNLFLKDIYGEKKIIKDQVVPEEFVFISSGYLPECEGICPPKGIYSHISGIDLVLGKDGEWYILEDNLRIPSGASYPMIAREICRRVSPKTFSNNQIVDNRNYAGLLKETLDWVNTGGIPVIMTPGRYNAAYFEHSYLAERTGSELATCSELFVENAHLYYRDYRNTKQKVGVLYRRISDEYLDQEPILKNAPTYLPYYPEDRKYVLDHLEKLVVKDVAEAGGYGVIFGNELSREKLSQMKEIIEKEPRRFIAQEVIDFQDMEVSEGTGTVLRKADLRAFVLSGKETKVWASGLTRFSRNPDSFVVNSSQGGGFKDTWVLSQ